MNTHEITQALLIKLQPANIHTSEPLVRILPEFFKNSDKTRILTLVLDGQESIFVPGRFAHIEVDSTQKIDFVAVFE